MSQNPTIIFDLDGTLADTILDLVPSLNRTIATQNLPPVSNSQIGYIAGKGVIPMIKLAYEINNRNLDELTLSKLFDVFLVDYEQNIAVDTVLFPGVRACLDNFAANDWNLGVCTNKPIKLAAKLLKLLEVYDMFGAVTGADSFDFRKPDPRHLVQTITLAGGAPRSAIMVGDSENDFLTAHNANIPAIAVDFGHSEHPVAHYNPQRIVSHYDEIYPAANTLISN